MYQTLFKHMEMGEFGRYHGQVSTQVSGQACLGALPMFMGQAS